MRIIHDSIYLFSVARSCVGRVVACRTADGDGAIGKNINEVLSLDKNDISYMDSRSYGENYLSVCLSCNLNGKKRAAALFDFMCRSSSLCLAVVFDFDISSSAKALSALGQGVAHLAPSLSGLCNDNFSVADHQAFTYISYVYGCIVSLRELGTMRSCRSSEMLRYYAEAAADFVGSVDIRYVARNDISRFYFNGDIGVFSGGICASAILTAVILARRFSISGTLEIEVIMGRDGASVMLGFDTDDEGALENAEFIHRVAETYGIFFDKALEKEYASILLVPFYVDVGFVGVKAQDDLPSISSFM